MLKVRDEKVESALCVGTIAALIWGIGMSLYGFYQGAGQSSWIIWGAQLVGGILACLVVPPAFVRGREWVQARFHEANPPLHPRP